MIKDEISDPMISLWLQKDNKVHVTIRLWKTIKNYNTGKARKITQEKFFEKLLTKNYINTQC